MSNICAGMISVGGGVGIAVVGEVVGEMVGEMVGEVVGEAVRTAEFQIGSVAESVEGAVG